MRSSTQIKLSALLPQRGRSQQKLLPQCQTAWPIQTRGKSNKNGSKVFRDSLVENMLDAIDKLEVFNLTGDPTMQTMQKRLRQLMDGVTPDALREDREYRLAVKREVDAAIAALPSLDM